MHFKYMQFEVEVNFILSSIDTFYFPTAHRTRIYSSWKCMVNSSTEFSCTLCDCVVGMLLSSIIQGVTTLTGILLPTNGIIRWVESLVRFLVASRSVLSNPHTIHAKTHAELSFDTSKNRYAAGNKLSKRDIPSADMCYVFTFDFLVQPQVCNFVFLFFLSFILLFLLVSHRLTPDSHELLACWFKELRVTQNPKSQSSFYDIRLFLFIYFYWYKKLYFEIRKLYMKKTHLVKRWWNKNKILGSNYI